MLTNVKVFCGRFTVVVDEEEQLMSSSSTCAKHLSLLPMTSSSLKWRGINLMGGAVSG